MTGCAARTLQRSDEDARPALRILFDGSRSAAMKHVRPANPAFRGNGRPATSKLREDSRP